jgi:hypothetical protein
VLFAVRHVEYAIKLVTGTSERVGYLLKDRIADVDEFVATLRQVAAGAALSATPAVARLVNAALVARQEPPEGEFVIGGCVVCCRRSGRL